MSWLSMVPKLEKSLKNSQLFAQGGLHGQEEVHAKEKWTEH